MKFKALRTKREPKEFIFIEWMNGTPILFTSDLPTPMPLTATMEGLKNYHRDYAPLPNEINLDDFELVEFEMTEISIEKS